MNVRIFVVRIVLGILFALLLVRFFFPGTGIVGVIAATLILVFFSYVFEAIHRREKDDEK